MITVDLFQPLCDKPFSNQERLIMVHQSDTLEAESALFEDDWSSFEPKEAIAWFVIAFVASILAAWVGIFSWFALRFLVG